MIFVPVTMSRTIAKRAAAYPAEPVEPRHRHHRHCRSDQLVFRYRSERAAQWRADSHRWRDEHPTERHGAAGYHRHAQRSDRQVRRAGARRYRRHVEGNLRGQRSHLSSAAAAPIQRRRAGRLRPGALGHGAVLLSERSARLSRHRVLRRSAEEIRRLRRTATPASSRRLT